MSICKKILMSLSAICMIIMLMLTAASYVIFSDMGYYRREFEKYTVTDNIDMSMDNIMYVMDELMDYLHDDRDDLENIITDVNGEHRDFFSEREKIHMEDCKELFVAGFKIRTVCTIIFIVITLILIAVKQFDIRQFLKICGIISLVIILFVLFVATAAIIDFDSCFVVFHKLFFNNDMWLLDPETDLIINILVQDFFADMALKIGIYSMSVPLVLAISGVTLYFKDKKRR